MVRKNRVSAPRALLRRRSGRSGCVVPRDKPPNSCREMDSGHMTRMSDTSNEPTGVEV